LEFSSATDRSSFKEDKVSERIRERGREYAKFLQKTPEVELTKGNDAQLQRDRAQHKRFQDNFRNGICYLCNEPLSTFRKELPCLHWLLLPDGFKKKDFLSVTKEYGFFQIQAYLRWVANEDGFALNINDMPEGGSGKLFATTIRYKNREWSFSCSETDYLGDHASRSPHYHFQMRIDNRPFIDYGNFHVPFNEFEITIIEAKRVLPDLDIRFLFGEGMRDALTDETVEQIVKNTKFEGVSENAPIEIDTLAISDEVKRISGGDLCYIIQEAKAKNVTIASLMDKLPNAIVRVMVSPGPGVVEQAPRSKRKKTKS
jgi:hypothetical protein